MSQVIPIISLREQRIRAKIDSVFGNSPQAQELKSIALKSALGQLTEDVMKQYWEEKERDLTELKERMPDVNDLALPTESIVIVGEPLMSNVILGEPQQIKNGEDTIFGYGEDNRNKSPPTIYEIQCGDNT